MTGRGRGILYGFTIAFSFILLEINVPKYALLPRGKNLWGLKKGKVGEGNTLCFLKRPQVTMRGKGDNKKKVALKRGVPLTLGSSPPTREGSKRNITKHTVKLGEQKTWGEGKRIRRVKKGGMVSGLRLGGILRTIGAGTRDEKKVRLKKKRLCSTLTLRTPGER